MLRTLEPEMAKNNETTEPWKIHDICKKYVYSNSNKGLTVNNLIN